MINSQSPRLGVPLTMGRHGDVGEAGEVSLSHLAREVIAKAKPLIPLQKFRSHAISAAGYTDQSLGLRRAVIN